MMQIVSRKEAVEQGLRYYYTGVPCKNGHLQVRLTTGGCKDCVNAARVQRDKVNVESIRAYRQRPETHDMCNIIPNLKGLEPYTRGIVLNV